jgi:hypothetical protein
MALVPPISSSYSGCGKFVKELEIDKRFASEVRVRECRNVSRTSETGH